MRVRTFGVICCVALAAGSLGSAAPVASQQLKSPQVVTVDFVKARAGAREPLLRFVRANWRRARATLLASHEIAGYRLLVSADTGSRWDVILETTYADSVAWSRREAIFAPVLKAQGLTLIDGKGRAELADIVEARTLTVDP